MPLWELEFHGWHLFYKKEMILGSAFRKLGKKDQEKALHVNGEVMAGVAEELDFSAITVPGVYWEQAPGHPAYFWLPEEALFAQIGILKTLLGDERMLVASCPSVLAMPGAEEYLEFSYTLMERPGDIKLRAEQLFRSGKDMASRLIQEGVGALYTASDVADNHGPYFNPEQMDLLIYPYLDRWAHHVHAEGGLSILHSDGRLDPILDQIADTEVMALQAIDPTAGMDLGRTMEQVGDRLCLCGNVDCSLFIAGSPEEVYLATQKAIESTRGKGHLVLGASNAIERQMHKENYEAFLRARLLP